jgi:tetratricopeptide (TPR) repeat protein
MTPQERCPSCGQVNEAGASHCSRCNFPLGAPEPRERPVRAELPFHGPFDPAIRRVRPIRPRRPMSREMEQRNHLAILLGGMAVFVAIGWLVWIAYQGFVKSNAVAVVDGAGEDQQAAANAARAELARDSTNLNAQIALANVLYDTANWPEAIVHYKSALRLDSTRVSTIVDMGVCYYNLSDVESAEVLFHRALAMDPRQPVALFNLGIVAESRDQRDAALRYYHQAAESGAPAYMQQGIQDAIERVMGKNARKASTPSAP